MAKGAKQRTSFFGHPFVGQFFLFGFPNLVSGWSDTSFSLQGRSRLADAADIVNCTESGKSKRRRRPVGGETWMHNIRPCWWLMGKWLMTWDWKNFLYQSVHFHPIPTPRFSTRCTRKYQSISFDGVIIIIIQLPRSSWTMSDKMSRCDTNYVESVCTGIDNARSVIWDLFRCFIHTEAVGLTDCLSL